MEPLIRLTADSSGAPTKWIVLPNIVKEADLEVGVGIAHISQSVPNMLRWIVSLLTPAISASPGGSDLHKETKRSIDEKVFPDRTDPHQRVCLPLEFWIE